MTAQEARKLTEKSTKPAGEAIGPWLDHVYARIKTEAAKGGRRIANPFVGANGSPLRMPGPTAEQAKAVLQALRQDGYGVVDHPDPDPGHYASHPYTTVSW